jgi:[ribosomal protein S18]-alanine N-acetyltransferase
VPFTVRDFQLEDFENLWRIDQDCFPPGISYSRQELKFYVRRRGAITLIAASDPEKSDPEKFAARPTQGEVAGFIVAHPGNTGHIVTIDVVVTARRFGVGSLLLRAAEDRLLSAGSRAVALETAVDNISALAFYKRHGYSVVKTIPRYYSNGVDALVLQKELT